MNLLVAAAVGLLVLADTVAQRTAAAATGTGPVAPLRLERIQLTSAYYAESACVGDFDRDGVVDVCSGPYWYAGPTFTTAHEIFAPVVFPLLSYATAFLSFAEDVDRDGWTDVVVIGPPGMAAVWYENDRGAGGHWAQHLLFAAVEMESPTLVDLDGDGVRELVCSSGGLLSSVHRDPANPTQPWTARQLSPLPLFGVLAHGLGTGDVNGDGRLDVLTTFGWFEQPPSLAGNPAWPFHGFVFVGGGGGGAQMFVDDVDGDGDADVITSLSAHGYGLSWFEQVPATGGGTTFVEHPILPSNPAGGAPHQFSQLHALALVDLDGDGRRDIVTGKCWLAHLGNDPGAFDPVVLYAFYLERPVGGAPRYRPVRIDSDSGVGRRIEIADVNGDGRPDVVTANKKGCFLFVQR